MSIKKAMLTVILKADETIVAEVEDAVLWQKVLSAIHSNSTELITPNVVEGNKERNIDVKLDKDNPLNSFAIKIGVSEAIIKGAIDPILDAPYLHLDRHCWEAMKKQTPQRGRGSISPTAMAATLLCLWFNEADLGTPTQTQALDVLKKIGIIDKNSSRGIKLTSWLQSRPSGIIINPAEISKANSIVKSFCTKKWSGIEANENN